MLVACHEADTRDRVGLDQLALLKGVIADEPMSDISHKHRRKQIDRLMVNLQSKKKMSWPRDAQGNIITDPDKVAQVLCDHWSSISRPQDVVTREQCDLYLKKLNVPASMIKLAPLLFRQNGEQLVREAFERQVPGAAPGLDGFSLQVYQSFRDFFTPLMFRIIQGATQQGTFP